MKQHKDFIMMVNSEKGILLAKDICKYISDPLNPMYDAATAAQELSLIHISFPSSRIPLPTENSLLVLSALKRADKGLSFILRWMITAPFATLP